ALNTVLNLLFINGTALTPALGIPAAAVNTTLARVFEMLVLLAALKPGPLSRLHAGARRRDARLVLRSSAPLMLKEVAWAGGMLASALIISRMGELPLAAYNLILPIDGVMISAVVGCAIATGILLGHALGRSAFEEARAGARRMLRLVTQASLLAGLSLALLVQAVRAGGWLIGPIAPELHDPALHALSMLCIGFGARAHNTMVTLGILRSGNDSAWLFYVDLCSMWLVNVPLVALAALVLHWSLPAVVAVMMLEEVFKVGLFRWRVERGNWLRRIGVTERREMNHD
ncbi:MAG TPA: MATE family efflux transporter, partial [Paucimonas sp.]|nr:MATE family efflux transporter [Paucimonas sp.]